MLKNEMGQGPLSGSEAKGCAIVHVHRVKFSHVTQQSAHMQLCIGNGSLLKSEAVPGCYLGKCLLSWPKNILLTVLLSCEKKQGPIAIVLFSLVV